MDNEMGLFTISDILYSKYKGEVNTDIILGKAIERAVEKSIENIVVASETGRSALRALKLVKERGLNLIVVTHYPSKTWGPRGVIPIGIKENIKRFLIDNGVKIVQGTRPLVGFGRSLPSAWDAPTPNTYIDHLLGGGVFGQGVKIAIEAAVMATDAGYLSPGMEVISLGGTYKGLDTALIVKTCHSHEFLEGFEVLEFIGKPRHPRVRHPEYEDDSWRGDLDQYYHDIAIDEYFK